jgi:biotin synthase
MVVIPEFVKELELGHFDNEVLLSALRCKGEEQEALFELARRRREEHFPDRKVEVRSVIEISNVCQQACNYCNMGLLSRQQRYTIEHDEFIRLAGHVYEKGRRVLLIQSGEYCDQGFVDMVARSVIDLTRLYPDLTLILCLGNMSDAQYQQLHDAGAKRYVLKFEASNPTLYRSLKPRDTLERRLGCLESLLRVGFQVGSGDIVGVPGQTLDDLLGDLRMLGKYDLSMESCTVFIPGESSNYRNEPMGDVDLTLNMMAVARILYPARLIPTTSSLEKGREGGQYLGLMAGANTVTIHDGTPENLQHLFPIYSTKRFTPRDEYLAGIVEKAGLRLSHGALR